MSPGCLLTVAAIQLATLLVPIAAGLAGLVSGATAGFASVIAWFVIGIPLSYGTVDARSALRQPSPSRPAHPARLSPELRT